MSQSIDLISAGHICLDVTPQFAASAAKRPLGELFRPGSLVVVDRAAVSTGGGAANVGLSARRLGLSVALMGKCGDDVLGGTLLEVLRGFCEDCAAGMRIAAGENTSYTVVLAPPGTDRIFLHCPGANDTFGADDVDLELVSTGRLFYFGYPPLMARMYAGKGEELAELLARVKARGVTTALDMALPDPSGPTGQAPWPEILAKALPHVDLFVPSVEELALMLRRAEYDRLVGAGDVLDQLTPELLRDLSGACLEMGAAVVMIKCGRHGLYVRGAGAERVGRMGSAAPDAHAWADGEFFRPSYRVAEVVSATGAGDSAVAGFLAGLLRGADLPTAADYACAAGAHNVTALDTTSGLRSWEQTTASLGDPRVEAVIDLG